MRNILILHPESAYGGSSKSILELLVGLPDEFQIHFLCPPGDSSQIFSESGYKVHNVTGIPQFNNTKYGFYSGFRWIILVREIFYIIPFILSLRNLRRDHSFNIIHCNEITCIFSGLITKFIFNKARLVLHIRSLQNSSNLRYKFIKKILHKYFDSLI